MVSSFFSNLTFCW